MLGRKHHQEHVAALEMPTPQEPSPSFKSDPSFPQFRAVNEFEYPPTLFSDANYQASCEGMAARSMINFAGDVGFQTFYQGIYLVLIAISMGVMKLAGYCSHKSPK